MTEFSWKRKALRASYFGIVDQIVCELSGVKDGVEELVNAVTVFPEHEQEHADNWTQERIDAHAELLRVNCDMEAEIERRFTMSDEEDIAENN